jgi:ABC-type lipoprotein export system ATPase subunit
LLLACGGLLSPDGGQVLLADTDVYAQSPSHRARLRADYIGFVFQQFHLIPYLSLKDNILSGAMAHQHEHPETSADSLMTRLDLNDRADHLVSALSIGERQRTALARALVCQPRLILADEPTGNLDPDNTQIVLRSLSEFAQAGGAVLLVTHDPNSTGYANRHFLMHQGVLRESLNQP